MTNTHLLAIESLSKCYRGAGKLERLLTLGRSPTRDVVALDGVSLFVAPGELVGLLGPNGSGKTTLLRCAAGLLAPDHGTVRVRNQDPAQLHASIRARVGLVMRDDRTFHHRLDGNENLALFARLQRIPASERRERIAKVIELAELSEFVDKPYRNFSAGMRTRLAFARALLADPVLLLLDEASSGLDPGLRVSFRRTLRRLADSGIGILFATHDLDEARELCDRTALLHESRVVEQGDWSEVYPAARRVFGLEGSL